MTTTRHRLCQPPPGFADRSLASIPSPLVRCSAALRPLRARSGTAAVLLASILAAQAVLGQAPSSGTASATKREPARPLLQRFDLNFPGGTPHELVAGIEHITGKPLNAIIPAEDRDVQLPPVKLTSVTVPDLFRALNLTSRTHKLVQDRWVESAYEFQSTGEGENAVWCFQSRTSSPTPNVCRFFQTAGLLDNFTIDDITTAIQTGWDLLGINPKPRLKFHAETKLLIAVGPFDQLKLIDNVLEQLSMAPPKAETAAERKAREKTAPEGMPKKDGPSAK